MKEIKGDLVLEKDTTFNESIKVNGNIVGRDGKRYDLRVEGDIIAEDINAYDINAKDITAKDITAWDIYARNIYARNIYAWNINARDIHAWDIICESRKKKSKSSKTIARIFITGYSKLERKEW